MTAIWDFIAAQPIFSGFIGTGLIGFLAVALRRVPGYLYEGALLAFTAKLEVESTDTGYFWLAFWLSRTAYARGCRRLVLRAGDSDSGPPAVSGSEERDRPGYLLFPALGLHLFRERGCWIALNHAEGTGPANARNPVKKITMRVLGRRRETLQEIIAAARGIVEGELAHRLRVFTNCGDYWECSTTRRKRPPDSVILRSGMWTEIEADLQRFLGTEERYAELGMPYRRGYLFFGPPGTGKSSTALALAGCFDLQIFMLQLSGVFDDSILGRLIRRVPRNAILLIEDIDAAFRTRKPENGDSKDGMGPTFSGLLNALDGAAAGEGQIVILTTNHIDQLDPALLRPGRVDVRLEFAAATKDQALDLFGRFFPESGPAAASLFATQNAGKTPAEIQQALVRMSAKEVA